MANNKPKVKEDKAGNGANAAQQMFGSAATGPANQNPQMSFTVGTSNNDPPRMGAGDVEMQDNSSGALASSQRGAAAAGGANRPQAANCVEEFEAHGDLPQARFGHTITVVHKTKVVLFGGATGDTGRY